MSERIITLFGEEIVPEHLKAIGRSRAKKKNEDKAESVTETPAEAELQQSEAMVTDSVQENSNIEIVQSVAVPAQDEVLAAVVQPTRAESITEVNDEVNVAQEEALIEIAEPVAEAQAPVETATPEEVAAASGKRERAALAELPDDWQGSKKYYSIGEVADIFKVKTSHIRFWTNEFKLKVRTTRKGDRLYTPEQIKELRTINSLVKERGLTIKGAKTRLKAPEKMEVETVDLKQSLLHLRNKLVAIKNQLK